MTGRKGCQYAFKKIMGRQLYQLVRLLCEIVLNELQITGLRLAPLGDPFFESSNTSQEFITSKEWQAHKKLAIRTGNKIRRIDAIKDVMLFFHMVARFVGQVSFVHDNTVNGKN
jgi:hypothetical protein